MLRPRRGPARRGPSMPIQRFARAPRKRDPTLHTNTVEGFFSLLKRSMYGTFHAVSKRHLHRYVQEAAFKHNTRGMEDGERVAAVIKQSTGRRLRYKEPVAKASQP